ncbi:hypothetical protein DFJ77DRAFT_450974 [Powellomyces hirtus]|nr:hypothetical protein DFJ77DRAFT_450974 [Powellomyces hirtus]
MKPQATLKRDRGPAKKGNIKAKGGAVNKPKTGMRGKRRAANAEESEAAPALEEPAEEETEEEESADEEPNTGRQKRIYPKSGKKGKKFADKTLAMSLIDEVNATEEKRVGKKLERNQRNEKIDAERTVKKQQKQNSKRAQLEQVKKELREAEQMRKKRRKEDRVVIPTDETKKKVSFQV